VDDSGCAYVSGRTISSNFPTTPGAFDTTPNGNVDVFVTKVSAAGDLLLYSTFLGGGDQEYGEGLTLGQDHAVYVGGLTRSEDFPVISGAIDPVHNGWEDIFVSRLQLSATPVIWGTVSAPLPRKSVLVHNYPNPFNPVTTIEFVLPDDGHVSMKVYDVRGALVADLVDGHRLAGSHQVRWDAADCASGM
jgi:hypothetical protein